MFNIEILIRFVVIYLVFTGPKLTVKSDQVNVLGQYKRTNISKYSTCGSKVPGTNVLLCHCDALCTYYKDCCYEYLLIESKRNQSTEVTEKVRRTECVNFPGDPNSFSMQDVDFEVSRLSATANRFVKHCQNPNKTNPFEALPVYYFRLDAHFCNHLCLQLYVKIFRQKYDPESLTVWTVSIHAECFQKYINDFKTNGLFGRYMEFLTLVFSRNHCNFSIVPPEGSKTRICFRQNVEGCSDRGACQSYQSPVIDDFGKMYKNAHCSTCAGSRTVSNIADMDLADDQKTILTLNHLWRGFEPYMSPLRTGRNPLNLCGLTEILQTTPASLGCNLTCPDNQMRYFNTCIEPVTKVRGFVHQVEVRTSSTKTLDKGHDNKEKIARAVVDMIDISADVYVISKLKTVKTTSSACLHIVNVTIYLKYDVTYSDYLNISSNVRDIFENRKEELKNAILNMTQKGEPCLEVGTSNGDRSLIQRQASTTDMIRIIIFSSIFGVFVIAGVAITVINLIMNKLARNRETETDE